MHAARKSEKGFTLIELILVMTVLVIAVSITAPALANFFRARTLDSEARRLLALTRQGQSRAASEGVPMELWIDTQQKTIGLEAEPSFEDSDPKGITLAVDPDVQIEALDTISSRSTTANNGSVTASGTFISKSNHPNLPRIRFMPDGSIGESSPQTLRLTGRDGSTRLVSLAKTRMGYEIGGQTQ